MRASIPSGAVSARLLASPHRPVIRWATGWATVLALAAVGACSLVGAGDADPDLGRSDPAAVIIDPGIDDPLTVVRAAAARTRAPGTARIRTAVTRVRGDGEAGAATITEADVDFGAGIGRGVTANGLEVVSVGDEFWFPLPPTDAGVVGATWLHGTASDVVGLVGPDRELLRLAAAGVADPTFGLDLLPAAVRARPLGSDSVAGVAVRGFGVVADLEGLVARADADDRATLAASAALHSAPELELEVWLDGDGRVRRSVETVVFDELALPPDLAADLAGRTVVVEQVFLDFGVDVDVELPAPEDTITLAELVALGG